MWQDSGKEIAKVDQDMDYLMKRDTGCNPNPELG